MAIASLFLNRYARTGNSFHFDTKALSQYSNETSCFISAHFGETTVL